MSIYDINGNKIDANDNSLVSISMIESLGIVGDSYASGEIYNESSKKLIDYYQLSWGKILGRMCGINVNVYSAGGLTSKTWLTDSNGLIKLNNTNPDNLYFIALGINDANNLALGSKNDIESDSTDTFYSYYSRVIRAIKIHAPQAIIIPSTIVLFGGNYEAFSNAIHEIGKHYDLSVADLSNNNFFKSEFFSNNKVMYHPTALNYSAMSKEYKKIIESTLERDIKKYNGYIG